ncbi:uncharacterized protein UBRO2_04346 [Ustilago bromivora]|uniref:Uncharacterized protein n=1 Tax=Ustilago bromivora TaxID=307758 RepID=A0A8H8TTZ6_9BASI|nr:uncharacterized protein UBRO2_04346 [Ustilago bromivora]
MLPPTLNPGSSPASPAVSTPPHDVPSSPSLPGLPASPRKKLLYDTLKKPFDDQDLFARYWIQMLELATLPNTGRKELLSMLDLFLDHKHFERLIDGLKSIADRLPESFVDSFLHHSGSRAAGSACLKEQFDAETLLERIEQSALFQSTLDPVDRLELVLQHAFVPGAPRRVRMPHSDFTSTFNGQALEMLVHHIKPKYFTKVLPIIQSSGFGKTRLCVQLSTVSPGMLVCLTQKDGDSEPPQDKPVYDYFQRVKGLLPGSLETKDLPHPTPKGDEERIRFKEAHLSILAWLSVYCQTTAYYMIQL